MSNLNVLRTEIRRILSEMLDLNEAQKTSDVDDFVNGYFKNATFYIDGQPVPSQSASLELATECTDQLKSLVNQIQTGNLPYENFYILKLSGFSLKTPSGYVALTFENASTAEDTVFKPIATSFLVYVYHDTLFRVMPYNENFKTDSSMVSDAEKFIASPQFDAMFGTDTQRAKFVGEIKTFSFEKKNRIYTNYFNPTAPKSSTDEPKGSYAKGKKAYRPNTPLIHKIFGKGVIKASKKVKDQEGAYILDVEFPDYGIKRIMMRTAA